MWPFLPSYIPDELFSFVLDKLPLTLLCLIGYLLLNAIVCVKEYKEPLIVITVCIGLLWLGYNKFDSFLQFEIAKEPYNDGVCGTLREDAYTLVLFLDDDESSWSENDRKSFSDKVDSALNFIRKQGQKYGYDLPLDWGYYDWDDDDIPDTMLYDGMIHIDPDQGDTVKRDMLEQVAKSIGFRSVGEMAEYHKEYLEKDQIAYILCVNKPGRSHTFDADTQLPKYDSELYVNLYYAYYDEVEYAVVYSKNEDKTASKAGVIVHEFLHLFGALDYYEEDGERVQREKLAKKLCPNDIMLRISNSLTYTNIGEFTAYTIGWLGYCPEEYNCSEWYH